MPFLQLQGLSKHYGAITVVSDIDLAVEKGEFVSLLGPSGCGKTTTLQMIAGFVDVSQGRILLDGQDITDVSPSKRGLGVVFQSYALFPHMSVFDNVSFGLEMRNIGRTERVERIRESLALVHLDHLAERYPRDLSGGQRQRVALARALVIRPPVLLLDEPMSNLDAQLREEMQFELRAIQRKVGTTTVMVTHDQSEALSISDRVVVMEAGRVTQVDAPYRAYEFPENRFVSQFIGKANMLPGVVREVRDGEVQIDLGTAVPEILLPHCASDTPLQSGDRVMLCIRPEKLRLCSVDTGRFSATVASRFFLGSQWLYRVHSALGELLVCCLNEGEDPHPEGAAVGIDWRGNAVRLLCQDAPHV